ncbi:MAG: 50S ribosomal protein L22 [Candidatus Zixiibacteriota bacterium]
MQARARIKYLRTSPKKMRQVADLIKGKPVEEAMNILNFTPKAAAHHLAKTLKSAASNALSSVGTSKLKAEDLMVSKVFVDSAPTAKRIRFQAMGRVFRLRKRYCHLTVEVEGEPQEETAKKKIRTKKESTEEPETETKTSAKKGAKAKRAVKKDAKTVETNKDVKDVDINKESAEASNEETKTAKVKAKETAEDKPVESADTENDVDKKSDAE